MPKKPKDKEASKDAKDFGKAVGSIGQEPNALRRALLDVTQADKVNAGLGDRNAQARVEDRKKKKEKRTPPKSRMAKP